MPWSTYSLARRLRLLFYTFAFALGSVSTWYFNLRYMEDHEGAFAIGPFVDEAFTTNAGGSLSCDILVAAMVGMVWMVSEAKRVGMKRSWVYVVLACVIAFAAAFPLFLFVRELCLAEQERAQA